MKVPPSSSPSMRLAAISRHIQTSSSLLSTVTNGATTNNNQKAGIISDTTCKNFKSSLGGQPISSITNTINEQINSKTSNHHNDANKRWQDSSNYRYWLTIQTRWSDNDCYGHMNNAKYYQLFDTIVNKYLIEECKEEVQSMGLVVHSSCTYLKPISFPTTVILGLGTEAIGRSSVIWRVGLWSTTTKELVRDDVGGCHAFGSFVHVFVDPDTRKKVPISDVVRSGATRLLA